MNSRHTLIRIACLLVSLLLLCLLAASLYAAPENPGLSIEFGVSFSVVEIAGLPDAAGIEV